MKTNKIHISIFLLVTFLVGLSGCDKTQLQSPVGYASSVRPIDEYTLVGRKHLVDGYLPLDSDGHINVVVEIPTGTTAKWEVEKETGVLKWEFRMGKPRVVSYLGYPGNYGMIPGTLLPRDLGGDGDALDVLVIGPPLPRGSVIRSRVIGVLKLLDGGEQDDKIISVLLDSEWGDISSIEELNREYKGIAEIIEIWFSNYKGPGKMQSKGYGNVTEANRIIEAASEAYSREHSSTD